jgi:hypothetical protein
MLRYQHLIYQRKGCNSFPFQKPFTKQKNNTEASSGDAILPLDCSLDVPNMKKWLSTEMPSDPSPQSQSHPQVIFRNCKF